MEPTLHSVTTRLSEYDAADDASFIQNYANGRNSKTRFLRDHGRLYPIKAIWAAAHEPPIKPSVFSTSQAEAGFRRLGFDDFVSEVAVDLYYEGMYIQREATVISRCAELVRRKKQVSDLACEACTFDFAKQYGDLGSGFIECHHLDPLSGRNGVQLPTALNELALLCSNCHRMVHRTREGLTIGELKVLLEKAHRPQSTEATAKTTPA